jgi:ATP-binding cassette subfamily B protein
LEHVEEAILALARRSGLRPGSGELPPAPSVLLAPPDPPGLERWVLGAAARLELEAEAVDVTYAEVDDLLRGAGPALLWLRGEGERLLLVLRRRGRELVVLAPDLQTRTIPQAQVREALVGPVEGRMRPVLTAMLEHTGIRPGRRARVLRELLHQRLGRVRLPPCWILRTRPGAPLTALLRGEGVPGRVLALVAIQAAELGVFVGAWSLIGRITFQGLQSPGWLQAWVLLLVTLVPLRMLAVAVQSELSRSVGAVLKRRLLVGAAAMSTDVTRREGAGLLLGRVLETGAIESLGLRGGLGSLLAVVEIALTLPVLAAGPTATLHVALFLLWAVFAAILVLRHARRLRAWADRRLDLTHHLVEAMVGHRTRLAQETPSRWHLADDRRLIDLLSAQQALDANDAMIAVLLPRGWLVLGIGALLLAFAAGTASPVGLAVGLGGVLLGGRALGSLVGGISALVGAHVAFQKAAPMLAAAATADAVPPGALLPAIPVPTGDDLVLARNLTFSHTRTARPVLQGIDLVVRPGDRILLEGSSGGGKSTLGALLSGLREPDQGLLLLGGLDRPTLGLAGWRRRVAAAPQFQENHVFSATFAFNLLMGRAWPASPADLAEAEAVCRELGLGDLLERMPGGLMQMVGETGWQLSHGERSRVYLARALLQNVDLIVLDESFAALDPGNLQKALRCVNARARAVLVIAHP